MLGREYWASRGPHDAFGDASHEQVGHAGSTVRSHDDQVEVVVGRVVHDDLRRRAEDHFGRDAERHPIVGGDPVL